MVGLRQRVAGRPLPKNRTGFREQDGPSCYVILFFAAPNTQFWKPLVLKYLALEHHALFLGADLPPIAIALTKPRESFVGNYMAVESRSSWTNRIEQPFPVTQNL
jgi:hypothetical protein